MSKHGILIKFKRVTKEDADIIYASINEGNIKSFKRLTADSYYQGKSVGIIEGAASAVVGAMIAYGVERIVESIMLRKKKKLCEDRAANLMNDLNENDGS